MPAAASVISQPVSVSARPASSLAQRWRFSRNSRAPARPRHSVSPMRHLGFQKYRRGRFSVSVEAAFLGARCRARAVATYGDVMGPCAASARLFRGPRWRESVVLRPLVRSLPPRPCYACRRLLLTCGQKASSWPPHMVPQATPLSRLACRSWPGCHPTTAARSRRCCSRCWKTPLFAATPSSW